MSKEGKEIIGLFIFGIIVVIMLFCSFRLFYISSNPQDGSEFYCKERFGQNYEYQTGSFSCTYLNKTTGIRDTREFSLEQLQSVCNPPNFWDFSRWKSRCYFPLSSEVIGDLYNNGTGVWYGKT